MLSIGLFVLTKCNDGHKATESSYVAYSYAYVAGKNQAEDKFTWNNLVKRKSYQVDLEVFY